MSRARKILTGHSRAVLERARVGAVYFNMVSGLVSTSGRRIYVKNQRSIVQVLSKNRKKREEKKRKTEAKKEKKRGHSEKNL